MSTLQLEVVRSLEGLSDDNLIFLLEMINKYMKKGHTSVSEIEKPSISKRIGALRGIQIFAPGYDFDEDNEEIAKLFGEVDE